MKTQSLIFPATEKPESSLYDRDRKHSHLHDIFIVVDAVVSHSHSAYRLLQSAANAIAHRHRSPSTGGSNSKLLASCYCCCRSVGIASIGFLFYRTGWSHCTPVVVRLWPHKGILIHRYHFYCSSVAL